MSIREANAHAERKQFFSGKRIFLSGHTGFKGCWLSLWLQSLGARVTGYSLEPPSQPSLFELARANEGIEHVVADIRDAERLIAEVARAAPDIVLHLAAQSLVRASYKDPLHTFATNVIGTANLLEAVRRTPSARVVLVVTSDKCYENRETHWPYRETDAMGGHDPYSASKGCAEIVASSWGRSFFDTEGRVAWATARAGNVIGGGDWAADRLIPDAIRAFDRGERVPLRSPEAMRPWQHVLEPLSGYLLLVQRLWDSPGLACGAWNFGPDDRDARSVSDVVDTLARHYQVGGWTKDGAEHPHEAQVLRLDTFKARMQLGWRPSLSLETALEWTAAWFKGLKRGEGARSLTLSDIARYERL